ncbi:MAG: hypothetical protein IT305_23580 [Chloroflexi bacterium]|nr:hypothetical protein [Chloroflexota bacterium]
MPRLIRSWAPFAVRLALVLATLSAFVLPFQSAYGDGADDASAALSTADWPSHDWRSPGFVGVLGGQMYDPDCWPLQSVGANVPNLIYRESIVQNLEWMRKNKVRWIRVFATGHGIAPNLTADDAAQRVRELTRLVEAYNRSVAPSEAIYLLIVLTDYYGHGVPGDVYLRDNPHGCDFHVLAAPWYRRGYQRFSFDAECGDGPTSDVPNYEVFFRPWVQQLVGDLADSPAILGWQLGNELKARNSARNGIVNGYDWYVDFVKDMTAAIRAVDKNHLIVNGAQYFAELTDIGYRPGTGGIDPDLRVKYQQAVDTMARACDGYCWNVWPLTFYDFNPYPVDDAILLERGGIATLATEYGFTLGSPDENQLRFGGDRTEALRTGMKRPWQDIDGHWYDSHPGLAATIRDLGLAGAAPWGSPYPNPDTDLGNDLDRQRGISLAPEGMDLWHVWTGIAQDLNYQNARAGASAACLATTSSGRALGGPPAPRPTPVPLLMARPSPSPTPPMDLVGVITGISTDVTDPTLIVRTTPGTVRLRMPKDQSVKEYNIGDSIRVRGWPMGDGVVLATAIERAAIR